MTTNEKIDEIFDWCDSKMSNNQFYMIDSIFRESIVRYWESDYILSFLTATLPGKSKLHYRYNFCDEIRKRDPELLKGLE